MTYRDVLREVVREMSAIDDTKQLAAAAVDRMSEEDRYSALMTFLPSLVRRFHNDIVRSESAGTGDLPLDERVFVSGKDKRLGEVEREEHDRLAALRMASAQGFRKSAARFRAFRDGLSETGTDSLRELTETDPAVAEHEQAGTSPRLEILKRALAEEKSILEGQKARLRKAAYCVSILEDPAHAGSLATLPLIGRIKEMLPDG